MIRTSMERKCLRVDGDGGMSVADCAGRCDCPGSMAEWDLPQPAADTYGGLEEPDYSRFENVSYPSVRRLKTIS